MPGRSLRDEMQGVAPVRSYGAPLGAQTPAAAPARPKVGPASPATQHGALEQAGLYRKPVGASASPAAPVRRPPPPAATAAPVGNPTRDLSIGTAAQRVAQYPGQVNQAIEEQSK
jgi:hypothetical protein